MLAAESGRVSGLCLHDFLLWGCSLGRLGSMAGCVVFNGLGTDESLVRRFDQPFLLSLTDEMTGLVCNRRCHSVDSICNKTRVLAISFL